jgi:hypothetical protein
MSEIRVNILDNQTAIHGEIHGYSCDALVAALTAEPETAADLALASARFIKPQGDRSPFAMFREGTNFEPYDAGVVVIDLAARIVAVDSTYSSPAPEGDFRVMSEFAEEDAHVPYRLSDDWLCVSSIPEYEGVCNRRREARLAVKRFDTREVLYGRMLSEFIARECAAARNSNDEDLPTRIHAKWLMTEREDLRGQSPRGVLLDKCEFIDFDLQWRALQWSFTKDCPPPLSLDSVAYRYSGFGTHENVVYYDLVRHLIVECLAPAGSGVSESTETERLEQLKETWLNTPDPDYLGRPPSQMIQLERQRMNVAMSAHESIVDEDCDICQAMAAEFDTPMIWHLDGCNMDDGFEFSFDKTREEFDAEERRREEFNRQFEIDRKAGKYDQPQFDSSADFIDSPTDFGDDDAPF